MIVAALVLYLVGLTVVFGLRTWLRVRRTGSSGFYGISGSPGSLRWWAGALFVLALLLGVAAPALAVAGATRPPQQLATPGMAWLGLVIALFGFVGVLAAQTGMGASWRIGVQETERTDLVTGGLFAVVRNPIATAMAITQAGMTLMVPTVPSVAALVCLLAAVHLQVRLIEEPYLAAVHGESYHRYAATTGRFVPGVGLLRSTTAGAGAAR